jgi:long-chain fatty acid transport protein
MVKDLRGRNLDGSDDTMSANNKLIEGRAFIDGMAINMGIAAGVYFDPLNNHAMKMGFSWTGQPGFGDTVMSGNLKQQNGGQPIAAAPTPIDFIQTYPDVFRFGFSWQALPKLEVHSDIEYVRWSWFKRQCIVNHGAKCTIDEAGRDRSSDDKTLRPPNAAGQNVILNVPANWRDTVAVRGGVKINLTDTISGFGSMSFSTSAVPKETISATSLDSFQVFATLGLKMKLGKHMAIAGSYTQIFYLDVDTGGRSIYASLPEPSRSPSADGVYKSTIGLFNANLAYTF